MQGRGRQLWKLWTGVLVLVGILVLFGCAPVGAGNSQIAPPPGNGGGLVAPDEVPELPNFLEVVAGPAGWVAVGVLVSMLLARWDWYNAQPSAVKQALPVAISAGVSIVARLLLTYVPPAFWIASAPYWYIIAGTVMTWLGSQGWYGLQRARGDARQAHAIAESYLALPHEE